MSNHESKSWLVAAVSLAVLMGGGAQVWRALQEKPVAAGQTTPEPAPRRLVQSDSETPRPAATKIARSVRPVEPTEPAQEPVVSEEPAVSSLDLVSTKDRLMAVTARCDAAEDAYRKVKDDSAQLGQMPHPSITQAWSRMRMALDSARRELDRGEISEARASLDVAEASAGRVVRAVGGN